MVYIRFLFRGSVIMVNYRELPLVSPYIFACETHFHLIGALDMALWTFYSQIVF